MYTGFSTSIFNFQKGNTPVTCNTVAKYFILITLVIRELNLIGVNQMNKKFLLVKIVLYCIANNNIRLKIKEYLIEFKIELKTFLTLRTILSQVQVQTRSIQSLNDLDKIFCIKGHIFQFEFIQESRNVVYLNRKYIEKNPII